MEEKKIEFQDPWNINQYGGYQPHQLYVSKKYDNLKDEILNNETYSLSLEHLNISITKAQDYMTTNYAGSLAAIGEDDFHYGVKKGELVKTSNLLSVILYTDWSDLSSEFSKSFRKLQPFEPLSLVKRRNQEFANWSKILRETVERFSPIGGSKRGDYRRSGENAPIGHFIQELVLY